MSSIPEKVRRIVYQRAGERCELCKDSRVEGLHHRQPKGMGGTSRDVHVPSNLLLLCFKCHHELIHEDPARAYRRGSLVRHGTSWEKVPVFMWWARTVLDWWFLDDEGGLRPAKVETGTLGSSAVSE